MTFSVKGFLFSVAELKYLKLQLGPLQKQIGIIYVENV